MSVAEASTAESARGRGALFVFGGALFLSATLLFAVQPMFAKMVLPRLGGAPGVWSVALVFFQGVLLAGYAYAHLLIRFAGARAGVLIHIVVLALGAVFLPLALASGWGHPPASGQMFWLLGLFGISVGMPFFALSANAPLLQAWFARTGEEGSRDPYFLYGASNLGSFIALIGYPLVMEPWLRLGTQSLLWSVGYATAGLLIAALGMWSSGRSATLPQVSVLADVPITMARRLQWILLAFIPSALLVAVTAHISTDIAAAPFLWVVPLALFLLTFVVVFRDRPLVPARFLAVAMPVLVAIVACDWQARFLPMEWTLALHLVTFFVVALTAHTKLYAARPPASRLTEFYLCMSFGGVLGGAFTGLAAPYIFPTILEYPLLLVMAFGLFVSPKKIGRKQLRVALAIAVLALVAAQFAWSFDISIPVDYSTRWDIVVFLVIGFALAIVWFAPLVSVAVFATALLVGGLLSSHPDQVLLTRSFFGVHKAVDFRDGSFRLLYNGTTLHGAIGLDKGQPGSGWPEPLTYYYLGGPMAEAIRSVRDANDGFKLSPVGIVGLGAGSLSCYREEGEDWRFYEIDADIVRIAKDSGLFRFIPACAPNSKILLGDARITLQDDDTKHELLLIDAFSSDAIPIHLLTREAVELYFDRLTPRGVLVLHISNRHLDLLPVVGAIADDLGLVGWWKQDVLTDEETLNMAARSLVVVLARNEEAFGALPSLDLWEKLQPTQVAAWTDDYSDILGALIRRWRNGQQAPVTN
jgi:hypothetical protein